MGVSQVSMQKALLCLHGTLCTIYACSRGIEQQKGECGDLVSRVAGMQGKEGGRATPCVHQFTPVQPFTQPVSGCRHALVELEQGLRPTQLHMLLQPATMLDVGGSLSCKQHAPQQVTPLHRRSRFCNGGGYWIEKLD